MLKINGHIKHFTNLKTGFYNIKLNMNQPWTYLTVAYLSFYIKYVNIRTS